MQKGNAFDIRNVALQKMLSREDEFAIFTRLNTLQGTSNRTELQDLEIDQLIDRLVKANIRFVVMVAQNYEKKGILPLEDLIAEGLIGLLEAIDRFDVSTQNKFVSYLVWWVRNRIYYAIVKGKGTTHHFYNKASKITKKIEKVEQAKSGKVNLASLFEDMGLTTDDIYSYESVLFDSTSLDEMNESEDPNSFGQWEKAMFDSEAKTPYEDYEVLEQSQVITEALSKLEYRERYIVRAMTGLLGNRPMTLKAVGLDIGLTHERTRQLYRSALGKLKGDTGLQQIEY